MLRKIKFRGKSKITNEWVYGYFAMLPHEITAFLKPYIIDTKFENEVATQLFYLVFEQTVGQFTGLYDKNGKEIYEGDIVLLDYSQYCVVYKNASFIFDKSNSHRTVAGLYDEEIEVIGNIHEQGENL